MNMKKTIAGIMAGAMAVSAMAATVSADQDAITKTFDLKKYVVDTSATARITVVANYSASLTSKYYGVTTDVQNELNGTTKTSYLTFGINNPIICAQVAQCYKAFPNDTSKIGGMTDFQITATPLANVSNANGIIQGTPVTVTWTSDKNKVDGSAFTNDLGDGKATFNMPLVVGSTAGAFSMDNYDLGTLGYSDPTTATTANKAGLLYGKYGFQSVVARMTYKVPAQVIVDGGNAWSWNANATLGSINSTSMVEKPLTAEIFVANGMTMVSSTHAIDANPVSVAVSAFTAGDLTDKIYPMKTSLNKPANVVESLAARKAGGNYYTKPLAWINDAIANHENVSFTFTGYDGYVASAKSHMYQEWVEADRAYGYNTAAGTDFDWYNPAFGQHLYTNLNDSYSLSGSDEYDGYGSYSSAWGINLFTGAVVVNSGITMQLNDTDKFDWGANTLTFDWFSITDEGKITDAKTFLQSMLLYTPVDWYWDNLTITVADLEGDDVDAGEGIDGEGDVIEDDEIVEDVEIVEEVVAETEAAPVETAPSPATGNSPIALAVIPVALAAAAVVAKKRG